LSSFSIIFNAFYGLSEVILAANSIAFSSFVFSGSALAATFGFDLERIAFLILSTLDTEDA
jgi:hypothetical protein